MDSAKKDIYWINYARAIGIIAIYYIHAQEFFEYSIIGLSKYIHPFYVNIFYFVSGYLIFKKGFAVERREEYNKNFFQNIVYRLIIPSILFSIIEYFPSHLIQHNNISMIGLIEKTLWGGTYWFISSLVVAEIIIFIPMSRRIKHIWFFFFVGCVFFLIGSVIAKKEIVLFSTFSINPWQFEKGFLATLFLVMGGVYWKHEKQIDKYILKPICAIVLMIVYVSGIYFLKNQIKVLISMNSINMLGVLFSILSIANLVVICKFIMRPTNMVCAFLDRIGKNTIGLYFVSGAIPKILMKFLPKGNLIYVLLGFVSSFALAWIVVLILLRFFPFLFDIRYGIRKRRS